MKLRCVHFTLGKFCNFSEFKKYIIFKLILFCIVTMSGCNTVTGIGQDIKSAGQTVSNTAQKTAQIFAKPKSSVQQNSGCSVYCLNNKNFKK